MRVARWRNEAETVGHRKTFRNAEAPRCASSNEHLGRSRRVRTERADRQRGSRSRSRGPAESLSANVSGCAGRATPALYRGRVAFAVARRVALRVARSAVFLSMACRAGLRLQTDRPSNRPRFLSSAKADEIFFSHSVREKNKHSVLLDLAGYPACRMHAACPGEC
jgi:hypothetical protein